MDRSDRQDLVEFGWLVAAVVGTLILYALGIAAAVFVGVTVLRWMGVL